MKKKDIYNKLEAVCGFLFVWLVLNENVRPMTIMTGLVVSMFTLYLTSLVLGIDYAAEFYEPPYALLKYFLYLLKEIYKSGYDMMKRILRGDIQPTFFEYDSKLQDQLSLVLLSNSVTLTPGTATVHREGNQLTVLAASPDVNEGRASINTMEKTLEKLERER